MKLHLGKMTNQELADWFGIKVQSLKNTKKKKLEELKEFAEFDEVYGGVNILKILNENYVKNRSKNYQIIRDSFNENWSDTGLDTCSNVAVKIYDKHRNELTISPSTTYNYTIQSRNELYGKPFAVAGVLGKCQYIWCKKEGEENGQVILSLFTEEEEKIKKELMTKYFKTDIEKDFFVQQMVESGELTKAEAYDVLCELKGITTRGFRAFMAELEEKIGASIVRGTKIDRDAFVFAESNGTGKMLEEKCSKMHSIFS